MASRTKSKPVQRRRNPTQSRSQATVAAILEAASQILHSKGKAAFNTNKIAERAGVGIGTLYEYFPNKTAILVALARQMLRKDGECIFKALDKDGGADQIRNLIHILFTRHRNGRDFRRVVLGAYLGEGLAADNARQVEQQIAMLAAHPNGPFAEEPIDPLRLFIVTRAVLGIARALTDEESALRLSPQAIEDETRRLIGAYLGRDLA